MAWEWRERKERKGWRVIVVGLVVGMQGQTGRVKR